MSSRYSYDNMHSYYEGILEKIQLVNKAGAQAVVNKILLNKHKYEFVERRTQVPWELIAAIHSKESSLNFKCNLCNGEPLNRVTRLVPKGLGPWTNWEDSAIDAIFHEKNLLQQIGKSNAEWNMCEALHFAHGYNGFGYVSKGINSPYLFAGTNAYTKGGYPSDGKYNPDHIVKNSGVWCILHLLNFGANDHYVKLTFEERGDLSDTHE